MFKWFTNLFRRKPKEVVKKRIEVLLPSGYYIKRTQSHWDTGLHTTYIAYRIEKDKGEFDDDNQLGSFRWWWQAHSACWSSHRLHKQIQCDLKTDANLKKYI